MFFFLFSQARHSASIGADGIAVISPSYFKPTNAGFNPIFLNAAYFIFFMFPTMLLIALPPFTDALRLFIKEVSAFAPDLPMYYYHIPSMTGVACKCSPHVIINDSQNTDYFVNCLELHHTE